MNYFFKLAICFILFNQHYGFNQTDFKVSGQVISVEKTPVIGALIRVLENGVGAVTNLNGEYELSPMKEGTYSLEISAIGFQKDTLVLIINNKDIDLSVELKESSAIYLKDIEIQAERITDRTSISNVSLTPEVLRTTHGLTEDPLRVLATLPGIGRGGDLFSPSQLYIRGGAPQENLFLFDNNKAYFPYFFGGQKSIFNTDVVENIELLTGGFSAAYGNHMSSVLNVKTKDGDFENYKGNILFGFYNAAAYFEGPILKDKLSFLLAVRRTYLDILLDETASFPLNSLTDVTYKVTYKLNENNNLSLSGLSSKEGLNFLAAEEVPGLPNKLATSGTNHFQSLQLKSSIRSKFYNKLSITNGINQNTSEIGENLNLNIDAQQGGFRDDFSYFISNKHKIKAGLEWQYGVFDSNGNFPANPFETDPNDTTIVLKPFSVSEDGEIIRSAYVLYDGTPIKDLGINAGFRIDQNPDQNYTDYSPRLSLNYQLTKRSMARFATGIYHQFNSDPGNANTGAETLKSSKAIHYILGFEYNFTENIIGTIEGYYKAYDDLVYYDENFNYSNDGTGLARGIEVFLRKQKGYLSGWISYALSHSERTVPILNEVRDFEFDQRHIFNAVIEFKPPVKHPKFFIPAVFVINYRFADGTPYTPFIGAINNGSGWIGIQGDPLSERNSDYSNLNFRVEWKTDQTKKVRFTSFVEIWNMLNSQNILGRTYSYGESFTNNIQENPFYSSPFLFAGGFRLEFGNVK